jgi:uncharacterized protein (TIGR02996 family)
MTAADFLAAVCAAPDDDTPRLAFADWLEEQGETDRAEFIRCQLWIAEIDRDLESDEDCDQPSCMGCRERNALRRREGELLGENVSTDGQTVWPRYMKWCEEAGINPAWVLVPGFSIGASETARNHFRRGFVHTITCTTADFLEHAVALCWHPIQKCRACGGKGFYSPFNPLQQRGCHICRGTGLRPCPETAQPIREVTLTTRPQLLHYAQGDSTVYGLRNGGTSYKVHDKAWVEIEEIEMTLLAAEWPGITFRLPDQP